MAKKNGRPSAFKKEYSEEIIKFMSQGYSATAFAGHIGVARSTVYKWADDIPEFSDALSIAQAKAALWWEKEGIKFAQTGQGSASMIIFGLKNRVAGEWRDKREVEIESTEPFGSIILQIADGTEDSPVSVN